MMVKAAATGASSAVDALMDAGVDTIFAVTGAGNLALLDEIGRRESIRVYFLHHEQAVVMAAQGYARVSGKIGVAVVTTGGGSSNAMTGILSAHLDSVPLLVISGNESSFHCQSEINLRAWGVQGFDSVDVFSRITKLSRRLEKNDCAYRLLGESIEIALNDRMGPVHIDFPMDLQRSQICPYNCTHEGRKVLDFKRVHDRSSFDQLLKAIQLSSQPVLYIGNGCRRDSTLELLKRLLKLTGIPFFLSWSAVDLFPEDFPGNFGRIGIYGERASNLILQKADLIVCLGTRLAIPQVGYDKSDFARNAQVWVIDIDSTELEKFSQIGWNLIHGDVRSVLEFLLEQLPNENFLKSLRIRSWIDAISSIRHRFDKYSSDQIGSRNDLFVHSVDFIKYLNGVMDQDAIVVTDVGAGLLSGHYAYAQSGSRRFFTSQGLGEMGFGLPAAIGAHLAEPDKQIVCLNTDGAIMFNLQELQSVKHFKIPLKLVIFNNQGYAMIRISQNNLFEGREFGSSTDTGISFPNFCELAKVFGFDFYQVSNNKQLGHKLDEFLRSHKPVVIEVMMDPNQRYYPRLATAKNSAGNLISPPIEDLDPKIPLDVLTDIFEGSVHDSSRQIER